MKKIRIIIIAVLLLTLCGCTTEYNLTINNDYSVEEKIFVYENNDYYKMFNNSKYEIVMSKLQTDKNALNYEYDVYQNGNSYGASLDLKYKNILEYKNNNKNFEILFENLNITKLNNTVKIHAYNFKKYGPFYQRDYYVEDAIICIKLPIKATNSNADEIDEKKHVYKWYINDTLDDIDIYLEYEENILGKVISSNYTWLVVGTIIFVFLLIVVFNFIKTSKKNNEI